MDLIARIDAGKILRKLTYWKKYNAIKRVEQ